MNLIQPKKSTDVVGRNVQICVVIWLSWGKDEVGSFGALHSVIREILSQ